MNPHNFALGFMGAAVSGALLDARHPEVFAILAVACVLWRRRG